jgi:predicted short-subunit dehydrogenase-like oxidoreductase (DUF2520 family)
MPQFPAAVAIVGAGPVAQALGRLLVVARSPVVAVASRSRLHAEQAAQFINGPSPEAGVAAVVVADISELPAMASRVLIAVSDRGVGPVAETLAAAGMRAGVAIHTCGARGPEALGALRAAGVSGGMLHPLQTIMTAEQGVRSLTDVTWGLTGDAAALEWAEQIVTGLHGRPLRIDPGRLSYYHAAAVMASNALMATLDAAVVLLAEAGVEHNEALLAIAPLARTSVANALANGPQTALTGPVARGDASTVTAHVRALRSVDPTVARLYIAAAAHLLELAARRGLSADKVRALEEAMDGGSGWGRSVAGE